MGESVSCSRCSSSPIVGNAPVSSPCWTAQARYRLTVPRCTPVARCTARSLSYWRRCKSNSRMSTALFLLPDMWLLPGTVHFSRKDTRLTGDAPSIWYTLADDAWYILGGDHRYALADDAWYIIARQLTPFTPAEVRRLLTAANCARDRAIILRLLDTGCRASEFVQWNVVDVNIMTGTVRVEQTKNRVERTVCLGAKARQSMLKHLAQLPCRSRVHHSGLHGTHSSVCSQVACINFSSEPGGVPEALLALTVSDAPSPTSTVWRKCIEVTGSGVNSAYSISMDRNTKGAAKMPGPQPQRIELDKTSREALIALTRRHTTAQQLVPRAQIVLLEPREEQRPNCAGTGCFS